MITSEISFEIRENYFSLSLPESFNPHSAGSKELLNNFKILTGQGFCESLPCSRACTKTKKRLAVILNQESIFLLTTNIFILLDEKINSRAKYF